MTTQPIPDPSTATGRRRHHLRPLWAVLALAGVLAGCEKSDIEAALKPPTTTTPVRKHDHRPPSSTVPVDSIPNDSTPGNSVPDGSTPEPTDPGAPIPTTVVPTTIAPTPETPTTPAPGGGVIVGTGAAAMTFPEKPGLTVPESSLKPYTGPHVFDSSNPGTYVFENCLVTDSVRLLDDATANVTFRNCKFTVDDYYGVQATGGTLTVEHSLFDGSTLTTGGKQFVIDYHAAGAVRYSEFRNMLSAMYIAGNKVATAEWNYIHDGRKYVDGTNHAGGIMTYDAPRPPGTTGPHIFIRNNYIADYDTTEGGAFNLQVSTDFGGVDGVRIEGNSFLPSGSYCVAFFADDDPADKIINVEVLNNRFFANAANPQCGYYGTHALTPDSAISAWSGNTLRNINGGAATTVNR